MAACMLPVAMIDVNICEGGGRGVMMVNEEPFVGFIYAALVRMKAIQRLETTHKPQ